MKRLKDLMLKRCVLLALLAVIVASSNANDNDYDTVSKLSEYRKDTDILRILPSLFGLGGGDTQEIDCRRCRDSVSLAITRWHVGMFFMGIITRQIVLFKCVNFQVQTEEVCAGFYDINVKYIDHIVYNTAADAQTFCGILPQVTICEIEQPDFDWRLTIDSSKAEVMTAPKSTVPMRTAYDLNIIHLTDIHYDPEYRPGTLAECPEPLCCRTMPVDGISNVSKMAGYWSDYRACNSPLHMIENAFKHIVETHPKIDYIYQTGDIVPQTMWSTTRDSVMEQLTKIHDLLWHTFDGIPVYPVIGNHDSHPANVFAQQNIPDHLNSNWLYEHFWTIWQRWLPPSTQDTILKGGYYTVSPKAGFRIISLNNNDCYIFNWFIYLNGTTASRSQLEWLQETLLAAEKAEEYVHILYHIPSGSSDCITVWAREFNRLVERFSSTIGGIFNGHSHADELQVHHSEYGYPMGISWNGGSLTSADQKNPNYRLYEVEPKTYQVVDSSTWIFDLAEANKYGAARDPVWFEEYKMSHFSADMSPAGIDALLDEMAEDPNLLRKYWHYKVTFAEPRLAEGCDNQCLLDTICNLAVSNYKERTRCKDLQFKLKKSLAKEITYT